MPKRCRLGFDEETKRRLRADYAERGRGADKAGELPVRPPCRRREHRWRVAAQDARPAEPLQQQQENWRQALNPSAQNMVLRH
jgi:hypothetical protein